MFRLIEAGSVYLVALIYVDDITAVGHEDKRDCFFVNLNRLVPINNLGELRRYAACHLRDKVTRLLATSQKSFTEKTAKWYDVASSEFSSSVGWVNIKLKLSHVRRDRM